MQARNLIGEVEDVELGLQYKACYARICDGKRKFLEAATHYYDLSQVSGTVQCAPDMHALHARAATTSRMCLAPYRVPLARACTACAHSRGL
jgi:hypothetical protein